MVMNESPERMKIDIDVGLGRAGMTRIEFLIGRIEVITSRLNISAKEVAVVVLVVPTSGISA